MCFGVNSVFILLAASIAEACYAVNCPRFVRFVGISTKNRPPRIPGTSVTVNIKINLLQSRKQTLMLVNLHSIGASTKHIFGNNVIIVHAFARLTRDYWNFCLVKNIRARFVRVTPLTPANDFTEKINIGNKLQSRLCDSNDYHV